MPDFGSVDGGGGGEGAWAVGPEDDAAAAAEVAEEEAGRERREGAAALLEAAMRWALRRRNTDIAMRCNTAGRILQCDAIPDIAMRCNAARRDTCGIASQDRRIRIVEGVVADVIWSSLVMQPSQLKSQSNAHLHALRIQSSLMLSLLLPSLSMTITDSLIPSYFYIF
jgi:hypothetical protein